jgi:hypothetical protein
MKLFLLTVFAALCISATGEETNAVQTATNTLAKTPVPAKPAASTNPAGLPSDVVAADSKILGLHEKMKDLIRQARVIVGDVRQRQTAHLAPLPTQNMQVNQLQIQFTELQRQLKTAETSDYQLRNSHHIPPLAAQPALPPFPVIGANRAR